MTHELSAERCVVLGCRDAPRDFDIFIAACLYAKPASAYTCKQRTLNERNRDRLACSFLHAVACRRDAFSSRLLRRFQPSAELPMIGGRDKRFRHERGEASRHWALVRRSFAERDSRDH